MRHHFLILHIVEINLAMTPTCVEQNCLRKNSFTMSSLSNKELVITQITLDLFSSATTAMMELTKLLVSCLLLIILSEAFLGSGRLSEIHFSYLFFRCITLLVSGYGAICLQIRAQDENVRTSLEFNITFLHQF